RRGPGGYCQPRPAGRSASSRVVAARPASVGPPAGRREIRPPRAGQAQVAALARADPRAAEVAAARAELVAALARQAPASVMTEAAQAWSAPGQASPLQVAALASTWAAAAPKSAVLAAPASAAPLAKPPWRPDLASKCPR